MQRMPIVENLLEVEIVYWREKKKLKKEGYDKGPWSILNL